MSRIWVSISVAWLSFILTEGGILDPRRDPALIAEQSPGGVDQQLSRHPQATLSRPKRTAPIERQERLDHLCTVFTEFQGGHAGHRQYFRLSGRLDTLDGHRLRDVDLSLDQRRFRTRTCCRKIRHHRYRCFDDYRIRRIDDFCGDGFPDIPFPAHTAEWHSNRQTQCCGLLAMDRIQCFQTTLNGAPEGENRRDDLDPADDAAHFIETVQPTAITEPDLSSEVAIDHPLAYPSAQNLSDRGMSSTSTTTTTTRSRTPKITTPSSAADDVCCAAGSLVGLEVTSHKLRTCSRKARQARRVFTGQNQEMCETMARTCCLRVAMRSDGDVDGDDDQESSTEDRLLASVMLATSATDPEERVDEEEGSDQGDEDDDSGTGGQEEESEGRGGGRSNRRRGRTASPRRRTRHRNERRTRGRGRRRNRGRA